MRRDLAERFKALYEESPLVETAVAQTSGFSQSKVSRILNGRLSPSPDDAATLAMALGASEDLARSLSEQALQIAEERTALTPTRVIIDGGTTNHQRRIGRLEQRSMKVSTYHPLLVPGLLQTEAYIAAVARAGAPRDLAESELREFVEARLDRQRAMAEAGRECLLIVPETALWWALLEPSGMADQADHIAAVARERPGWRIGVIPRGAPPKGRPVYMLNGFDLYDRRAVLIGTTVGNALVTDESNVAKHEDLLARLRALALFDDDADRILRRIAREYRAQLG